MQWDRKIVHAIEALTGSNDDPFVMKKKESDEERERGRERGGEGLRKREGMKERSSIMREI